jgi:hypothetical protein
MLQSGGKKSYYGIVQSGIEQYLIGDTAAENVTGLAADPLKFYTYSRININRVDLYEDGVSIGNSVVASTADGFANLSWVFGGVNFNGSGVLFLVDGYFKAGTYGYNLSAAQALTLSNAINSLNTNLSR